MTTGKKQTVWALVVVLPYSRHQFVWPLTRQTLEESIEGLEMAWRFFGGVPKRLLLDNFSAAIAGPDALEPRPTRGFLEYSQERGFFIDAARVRRPRDKPLIAGGMIGDLDPTAGGYRSATELARFDAGAVTFWVYAFPPHFHPAPREVPAGSEYEVNPNEVCLGTVDSRMPSGTGGSCGVPNLDPEMNPMKVSVHNSQGFAHVSGLVTPNVARVRVVTEEGREVIVEPGPEVDGVLWRGFIAVAPGSAWFVDVQALDADGTVIATHDFSDHPTN